MVITIIYHWIKKYKHIENILSYIRKYFCIWV